MSFACDDTDHPEPLLSGYDLRYPHPIRVRADVFPREVVPGGLPKIRPKTLKQPVDFVTVRVAHDNRGENEMVTRLRGVAPVS